MPGGRWHKVVFAVSALALIFAGYFALVPSRGENLESFEHRIKLSEPPDLPDPARALPGGKLNGYWEEGRMVWVQPVADKKAVKVELPLPRPTLAVPPMPLPDPSPLLERSGRLPRWGELPRAPLEEEE